jgi:hypothetical protein
MLAQLGSYLGRAATVAGKAAVKIASHSRQRRRCSRYSVAASGAWPTTLMTVRGGES